MRKVRSKTLNRLLTPAFLIGSLVLFLVIHFMTFLYIPPSSEEVNKIIDVPPGATLREVATLLSKEHLITQVPYFILLGKLTVAERNIKPGEYAFTTRMPPLEILDSLKKGKILTYELVVPEGYTADQIAHLVEAEKMADYDTFIDLVHDPAFIRSLGLKANTLEGYLFPDTYYFPKKIGAVEVIQTMVAKFQDTYEPDLEDRADELDMTENEVVTLASMIEKETSVDVERPRVSAVFHNRLERKMPLQSDPTVIYALMPNFHGTLNKRDLRIKSPYNTYRHIGLPPGPIANPGRESLYAALYPEDVNYLYFVSKNDGTHYFSLTLQEHNRAVRKYQKRRTRKTAMRGGS
jgi:peptidoglycan lytic transglycosylase G